VRPVSCMCVALGVTVSSTGDKVMDMSIEYYSFCGCAVAVKYLPVHFHFASAIVAVVHIIFNVVE